MVIFILHIVSWQQYTGVSTDGEFLQRTAPSSLATMHPFCCRAAPFSKDSEEKHCRPKQRWIPLHEKPSHTHSTSPVLPLSAEHTQDRHFPSIYNYGMLSQETWLSLFLQLWSLLCPRG